MSNTYFQEHKNDIFRKYPIDELVKDVDNYIYGSGNLHKVLIHFFDECLYKCAGVKGQVYNKDFLEKSPYDALNSDRFMNEVYRYISLHKDFYNSENEYDNVRSFFRNCRPRKVANFPVRSVRNIVASFFPDYDLFSEPLNIHDSSCGFGSRMSANVLNRCNYFGTDPNVELNQCLHDCYNFYRTYYSSCCGTIDIRCQGSEIRIDEWEGKMDFSFTSPPYFNLEVYSKDSYSSSKNYDNYELWKSEYLIPTCKNINFYLKPNGIVAINTKNLSSKKPIFDDFVQAFENIGLKRLDDMTLTITSKSFNNEETFKEPIMVFKKNVTDNMNE